MKLYLIYDFQASFSVNNEFHPAEYRLIQVFSERDFLEFSLLQELAKSIPETNYSELTFLNLDDLKLFVMRVLEYIELENALIISAQNYNIGLDSIKSKHQFYSIFDNYGELITKNDKTAKKTLLGKIFT